MRIELVSEIENEKVVGLSDMMNLANAGNIDAINLLGEWMMMGFECSPDVNFAVKCFEKAARLGNTQAMLNLGLAYIYGYGKKQDFYAAERWVRAADECGDPEATIVCKEVYFTTIGNHKPSLKAYIDFIYSKFPRGNGKFNSSEMKKMILAGFILPNEKAEGAKLLKIANKITEADILAFETTNDIYHSEDEYFEPYKFDDFDKKLYLKNITDNFDLLDRDDIAVRCKILYNLCDKKQEQLRNIILNLGYESPSAEGRKDKSLRWMEESLSWVERALFEINPLMFGSFSSDLLDDVVNKLRERLDYIEDKEISAVYDDIKHNKRELYSYRGRLSQIQLIGGRCIYSPSVRSKWEERLTKKIFEIEDGEIQFRYESVKNDYKSLCTFASEIKNERFEKTVLKKWSDNISNQINKLQTEALKNLCNDLENKPYAQLKYILVQAKNEYNYNKNILDEFVRRIYIPIDYYEQKTLREITTNIDGWSAVQYRELLAKIEKLNFKDSNTHEYVELVKQKLQFAQIIEQCSDEKLALYDLDQLNELIKKIHFTSCNKELKGNLSKKINHYIDLIYECKDQHTLNLLEQCKPGNIVNCSEKELIAIRAEMRNHQRLKEHIKNELLDSLNVHITICVYERKLNEEKDNYQALINLLTDLKNEKLENKKLDIIGSLISKRLYELQTEHLNGYIECLKSSSRKHIKVAVLEANEYITVAKRMNLELSSLEAYLKEFKDRLHELELEELNKICEGLSRCSISELSKKREVIDAGDFEEGNKKYFKKLIDDRVESLYFAELTKKCTQVEILKAVADNNRKALDELLVKLREIKRDDKEKAPYISRISSFICVLKKLDEAEKGIYAQSIQHLHKTVLNVMPTLKNTFCIYGPDTLKRLVNWVLLKKNEQMIFAIKDATGKPIFVITNLKIICSKYGTSPILIKDVKSVSSGMFFKTITFDGVNNSITLDVPVDSSERKKLADLFWKVILIVKNESFEVDKKIEELQDEYSLKWDYCFAENPIPGEICKVVPKSNDIHQNKSVEVERNLVKNNSTVQQVETEKDVVKNNFVLEQKTSVKKLSEYSEAELSEFVQKLFTKHNITRYLAVGGEKFNKKISKAVAAYAFVEKEERILMMFDSTLFGSAKDGFVFTDKKIYFNSMLHKKTSVNIDEVKDMYHKTEFGVLGIYVTTNRGDFEVTSSVDKNRDTFNLFKELVDYIKSTNVSGIIEGRTVIANNGWVCNCGSVNSGKFCGNCGARRREQ